MRFEFIEAPQLQVRESLGYVKDIIDPSISVREPLTEYSVMLDLVRRDPVIARAFDIIVDFATHRGYDFVGGTRDKRDDLRRLFDTTLNFQQVLPNLVYSLLYYGDAFLELRRKSSKTPNELWVLETTEMRIIYDEHGVVEGYVQRPFSLSGLNEQQILDKEKAMGKYWKPEEVIHFRKKWIGSQVYSYNPMEAASTAISANLYSSNYLMKIFMNMPPRYHVHFAGMSEAEKNKAKNDLLAAKLNYTKTIAVSRSSDPNSKPIWTKIEPPYDPALLEVKRYLRREILMLTGVPQSWIEESAGENRGITEAEQRPFDVLVKALHRNVIEPPLNLKLLPQLGVFKTPAGADKKVFFRFNEISTKGEKEILENAERLTNMGLKPQALVKYLDERGILGLDPDDFDVSQLTKDKDLMPSRKREDKSTDNMKSRLDSQGVSQDGGEKLGIRSMTAGADFSKYPYVLNEGV